MKSRDEFYDSQAQTRFRRSAQTRFALSPKEKILAAGNPVFFAYSIHTMLIIISFILAELIPSRPPSGFINQSISPVNLFIEQLIKWDAHWYTYIAQYGYDSQSIVFFPTVIVLIKILSFLGLSPASAGLLLCNSFAYLSFHIMYLTFRLDYSEKVSQRALLAYSVMPTSFFLNSIYTESLFIVFSLACLYFARQQKWVLAGIHGAIATLTRNLGIVLFLYLVLEYRHRKNLSDHGESALPLFFPPAALLLFMVFNHYIAGNPLAFLHSQEGWGRYFNSPFDSFISNLSLTFNTNPYIQPGASLDTFMVLLTVTGLTLLSLSNKFQIRHSYLLVGWLWVIIPLMSTSTWLPLYSSSRFVLVVFPVYLFLAQLSNRWYYGFLIVSSITLSVCGALFMKWYWVG